jgi:hypothetical protein
MIRIASFVLLLGSVNLMAQTTEVFDGGLLLHPQAICGPRVGRPFKAVSLVLDSWIP